MKKLVLLFFIFILGLTANAAGYNGTLPDIESEFSYLRENDIEKAVAPYTIEELDKQNEQLLKPIPREDDSYVDIIIKKDKTTQYLKDVNSVIIILEKLRKCLNTNQEIQLFNAIVSNLIDHVAYIQTEYADKPESNYLSYNRLAYISQEARAVANFRMQGLVSQTYLPYTASNNIYTKENLEEKLEELLVDVNETLFILKNLE